MAQPQSSSAPLTLRLVGTPGLCAGGRALPCGRMGVRLLAVLALDGPQERLRVAGLLWAGDSARALHNLRMTLHTLRRTLAGAQNVLRDDHTVLSVDLTRLWVDVLHPPRTAPGLLDYWQDFMVGHQTRGSEPWLEWVTRRGRDLLGDHLLLLSEQAHANPAEAAALLCRARTLRGQEEGPLDPLTAEVPGPVRPLPSSVLPSSALPSPVLPSPGGRPGSSCRDADEQAQEATALLPLRALGRAAQLAEEVLASGTGGRAAALALNVLATVALEEGRLDEARRLGLAALCRIRPAPPEASYTAAYLHDVLGWHEAARRIARQALRGLRSGESPALFQVLIASTYDAAGRFREARAWHEEALEQARQQVDPYAFVEVATYVAWHLNATEGETRARRLLDPAMDVGTAYPELQPYLQCTLGDVYLQAGHLDAAEQTLRGVETPPGSPRHLLASTRLAVCWQGQGQPELAVQQLRELVPHALASQFGQARLEWAVAALHLGDPDLLPLADLCARGARTNEPFLPATFRRLRAVFPAVR